ncbi:unnamed protein product [Camellia sinensis]
MLLALTIEIRVLKILKINTAVENEREREREDQEQEDKRHGKDQGSRAETEVQGRAVGPVEGSQSRTFSPPRRQGHRWCPQQALQDKGGEVVNSASVDGDLTEAEIGSEGGLQEQEVPSP